MICPHCHNTIREEDHYIMSARKKREEPVDYHEWWWVIPGLIIIGFLVAYGAFDAASRLIH